MAEENAPGAEGEYPVPSDAEIERFMEEERKHPSIAHVDEVSVARETMREALIPAAELLKAIVTDKGSEEMKGAVVSHKSLQVATAKYIIDFNLGRVAGKNSEDPMEGL